MADRGGEAEPIGYWGLAEIERQFPLWHRFRAGEFDRQELRGRLVPLQARLGRRRLRRGQENPDRKAAGLWTFARMEGVEPTNKMAERAVRPAVLWRKGCFGLDSGTGCRYAERRLNLVASGRQPGRSLLDFLAAAGEATFRSISPPSLLPVPAEG